MFYATVVFERNVLFKLAIFTVELVIFTLLCIQDLFDYITMRGALHESATCRRWFNDMVDTIIAVHQVGVVHRDIKDENFIVDLDTNRLYLIDFGAGSFIKRSAYTEYNGGSPISQLTELDVAQPVVDYDLKTAESCR